MAEKRTNNWLHYFCTINSIEKPIPFWLLIYTSWLKAIKQKRKEKKNVNVNVKMAVKVAKKVLYEILAFIYNILERWIKNSFSLINILCYNRKLQGNHFVRRLQK